MLSSTIRDGRQIWYRPGSSDWDAILEVLNNSCYAMPGFDVKAGERWLDLGANIGAFSIYCEMRGATVEAYEPDNACFDILNKNVLDQDSKCVHSAVTARQGPAVDLYGSPKETNHWRGTVIPTEGYVPVGTCRNTCGQKLLGRVFTGVKMDIEGAEHALLDHQFLPKCDKLVLEYHTSRDPSVARLAQRLTMLRRRFTNVVVPSMYDTAIRHIPLGEYHPTYDGTIWAWN